MYIGIDPGVGGAIALYDPKTGFIELHDMPAIVVKKGQRKVVATLLLKLLEGEENVERVFVERLQAMPKNGKHTAFSQGHSMGVIEGVVASLGYPLTLISPAVWKKGQGLTGAAKDASRLKALEKFPGCAVALKRKMDVDRAEALLIAEYGARQVSAGLM